MKKNMVGVAGGSSQSSSSVPQKARSFDVGDESQLLQLLNHIRRGPFDSPQKSAFRDAVLDFSSSQDISLLSTLAETLASDSVTLTHNGKPLVPKEANMQTKQVPQNSAQSNASIGKTRPKPTFGGPPTHQSVTPPDQSSIQKPNHTPIKRETEVKPDEKEPVTDAVPKSSSADMVRQQTQVPQSSHAPETVSSPPTAPPSGRVDPLERIREIKRLVNEKVGNPINLIDANNQIGREYMNALLNAMRVAQDGKQEEIPLAMQRLEASYQSIEKTIDSGETVVQKPPEPEPTTQEKEVATSVQSKQPEETVAERVVPKEEIKEKQTDFTSPAVSDEVPSQDVVPKQTETHTDEPATPLGSPPEPIKAVHEEEVQKTPMQSLAEDVKLPSDFGSKAPDQQVQDKESSQYSTQSLAEKLRLENEQRESLLHKRSIELQTQQTHDHSDPLQSNEVSAGLQQLLSEWKLFKGSGIFGIGPGGYEHPLYKTLSALPMAAVIAGRFEGATPEVKQSIADYMNGWRYEHNIVHEMNETFEHYLRRVIAEILSKQKAPKSA